jgi:hypothetical protein
MRRVARPQARTLGLLNPESAPRMPADKVREVIQRVVDSPEALGAVVGPLLLPPFLDAIGASKLRVVLGHACYRGSDHGGRVPCASRLTECQVRRRHRKNGLMQRVDRNCGTCNSCTAALQQELAVAAHSVDSALFKCRRLNAVVQYVTLFIMCTRRIEDCTRLCEWRRSLLNHLHFRCNCSRCASQ